MKRLTILMVVLIAIGALLFSGCDSIWPGANEELSAVVKIIDAPESMWGQDINWWQTKGDKETCYSCHEVFLEVEPDLTGTVSHSGWHSICSDNKYAQGAIITITATANPGYEFVNWTTSSSGVSGISSNDAITTFYMPCNDVTITAHFEKKCIQHELKLQAAPGTGGTVSAGGDYCKDVIVDISATAKSDWMFTHWTPGTDLVDEFSTNTTIKMPDHDVELTAYFKKIECPECPECEDCPDCPECIECLQNCDCDVDVDLPIWNSEFDKYVYVYFNIENTGADIQEYTVTFTAYGVTPGIGTPIKSTDYTTYTGSVTGKDLAVGEGRDSFAQIDVSNDKVVWVELANLELQ